VVPVGPISIDVLSGGVLSARSGVTGQEFEVTTSKTITIPRLEMHEIVVATRKTG